MIPFLNKNSPTVTGIHWHMYRNGNIQSQCDPTVILHMTHWVHILMKFNVRKKQKFQQVFSQNQTVSYFSVINFKLDCGIPLLYMTTEFYQLCWATSKNSPTVTASP